MKKNIYLHFSILLSVFLGLSSYYFPFESLFQTAEFVGSLFLKFLKLLALPLIFLSLLSSLTGMRSIDEMRIMGKKIVKYTLATTLIAAFTGLFFYLLLHPSPEGAASGEGISFSGNYLTFLQEIIPENLAEVFLKNNVLGAALISILLGTAILKLKSKEKEILHTFFQALFNATLKITSGFILLMPIGIWAFVTLFVRDVLHGDSDLKSIMIYACCVIGANLFQGIVVLPLFLKMKKVSPIKTFRGMFPALVTAFFTKSSNAALPVTLECAEKTLKVSPRTAKISLPLCSIINMNGCAAFILITVLFVAHANGLVFSFPEMILWAFLASLAAVGNAGVPMGCYFLASAFLVGLGVPLSLMGIILPFYSLLDMIETALNVWSDSCISVLVDRDLKKESEEKIQVPLPQEG